MQQADQDGLDLDGFERHAQGRRDGGRERQDGDDDVDGEHHPLDDHDQPWRAQILDHCPPEQHHPRDAREAGQREHPTPDERLVGSDQGQQGHHPGQQEMERDGVGQQAPRLELLPFAVGGDDHQPQPQQRERDTAHCRVERLDRHDTPDWRTGTDPVSGTIPSLSTPHGTWRVSQRRTAPTPRARGATAAADGTAIRRGPNGTGQASATVGHSGRGGHAMSDMSGSSDGAHGPAHHQVPTGPRASSGASRRRGPHPGRPRPECCPWRASASSTCPGCYRDRTAPCCWPTWARTSSRSRHPRPATTPAWHRRSWGSAASSRPSTGASAASP